MAHLVPLKPYAAPVPRSQSLCDQPTKTMSAFPTQDPSLTPTPRPNHSRELVRQNSDPTSEIPAPQAHLIREERGPWIRLPDVELPPKVRFRFKSGQFDSYLQMYTYFFQFIFNLKIGLVLEYVSLPNGRCKDTIEIIFLSDSTKNRIYCYSSQHQPYLGHQASSKSKVLPDWTC